MKHWKNTLLIPAALALVLLAACGRKQAVTLPIEDGPAVADSEKNLPQEPEKEPDSSNPSKDGKADEPAAGQPEVPETPEETEPEEQEPVREAVRVDGVLYYATGEPSALTGRCGTWDGVIDTAVPADELPQEGDSSNFGTGYYYQFAADGCVELDIDGRWMVFRREDICGLPVAANPEQTLPVEPEEPPVQE